MAGAPVTWAGSLPGSADLNGATYAAEKLIADKERLYPVVGLARVKKIVEDVDKGGTHALLRWHHIELTLDEHESKEVGELLQRIYSRRTGKLALPFEAGEVVPSPELFPEEGE